MEIDCKECKKMLEGVVLCPDCDEYIQTINQLHVWYRGTEEPRLKDSYDKKIDHYVWLYKVWHLAWHRGRTEIAKRLGIPESEVTGYGYK